MGSTGAAAAEVVDRHPALGVLGRAGWVAKGVVYAVLGALALAIALGPAGGGGESASQRGAIERLAASPLGAVALWMVGLGLVLYALWRFVTAVLPGDSDAETIVKRLGFVGSGVIYAGLAVIAISLASGARSEGSGSEEPLVERISSDLIESGWGRWLVGAGAAIAIGMGVYYVVKGWTQDFTDRLAPGGVGPIDEDRLHTLGTVGWIARGAVLALVGITVGLAAITADPEDAEGLDGSLRDLADGDAGAIVVGAIGIGLMVYGLFAALSAPKRRLAGP